ncbi:PaaI family thioesterase [Arthrobacter sp. MMS18-M83]|uniref:PaaI family thioesterase n=1 Tax=Arthrobacter sp. MMS18-M83 TaxID=2996261 RepID=UPI00227ABB80|nr:PaaI family thioesterase [Arthrobacter sp. MMS18-M83]WAH96315.1 PaaI family thioesterase [Arthrobacter sp. MMS18-M83]
MTETLRAEAPALPDIPALPETPEESALAEFAAETCRRLSAGILGNTGEGLKALISAEVDRLQSVLRDPSLLEGMQAQTPPRFDRKGRLQVTTNPVVSHRNPLAPPLVHHHDGDESEFRVTLPLQYQGPRNNLHGGYCAVLLDDVLWHAVRYAAPGISFTRELTITYERPVPLFEELRIVGRVSRIEGRKTFADGEIIAGDVVCARATGLWISPKPTV